MTSSQRNNYLMMIIETFMKPALPRFCNQKLFFMLLLVSFHLTEKVIAADSVAPIHLGLKENYIECTVYVMTALAKPEWEARIPHRFSCSNHGATVELEGDHQKFFSKGLESGTTQLSIPMDLVSVDLKVNLDESSSSDIVIFDEWSTTARRSLRGVKAVRTLTPKHEGSFTMLVVRVSDKKGHSPTYSARELSNHVFNDKLNMADQFRACSNDKLTFKKAGNGSDVSGGVVDIVVDMDLSTALDSTVCVNAADNALLNHDVGEYTHTMYICPAAVDFGNSVGVAVVNGYKSWFSDTYGSSTFVQMHEIGHNLLFSHSGEGDQEYGDPTGIMGGMIESPHNWGRMCFNAANTFHTGWYSNHQISVSPEAEAYNGDIVDVNAVYLGQINDQEKVVIRVQGTMEDTLFFMLHRLEGITSDMHSEYIPTYADRVNIVRRASQGASSMTVAQLTSGKEYTQSNWAGTGKSLHIKVCSIARKSTDGGAKVLVFLEGEKMTCHEDTITTIPGNITPASLVTSTSLI